MVSEDLRFLLVRDVKEETPEVTVYRELPSSIQ